MAQPLATNLKETIKDKFGQFRTFIGQIAQSNKTISISNCFIGTKSQHKPTTKASSDDGRRIELIRQKAGSFHVLIIGQANAGKTTILQKVCNTTEQAEIFDSKGKKVRIRSAKDQHGVNDADELL
jgi:ribosome-interacting GTPase 1